MSEERKEAIAAAASEEANPLETHYDADREVRAKGAAFYRFSGDEEKRRQEMEELRAVREATERTRKETGAVDILPGDFEGMTMPEGAEEQLAEKARNEMGARSRAMEKRKREIEERRKLLDAKRRKVKGGDYDESAPVDTLVSATAVGQSIGPLPLPSPPSAAQDPFASLESQVTSSAKRSRWDAGAPPASKPQLNEADAFLAKLERDMLLKGE